MQKEYMYCAGLWLSGLRDGRGVVNSFSMCNELINNV